MAGPDGDRGQASRALRRRRRSALVPARRHRRRGDVRRRGRREGGRPLPLDRRGARRIADAAARPDSAADAGDPGHDVSDEPVAPTRRRAAEPHGRAGTASTSDLLGAALGGAARRAGLDPAEGKSTGHVVWHAMGGWRGILESVLPSLAFVVALHRHDRPETEPGRPVAVASALSVGLAARLHDRAPHRRSRRRAAADRRPASPPWPPRRSPCGPAAAQRQLHARASSPTPSTARRSSSRRSSAGRSSASPSAS